MKNTKFAYGTQSRKTLPFILAGLTFFSRPLTVAEDLALSDVGDRYDLDAVGGQDLVPFFDEQTALVADLLRSRVQGDDAPVQVTPEWVRQHVGVITLPRILGFLRSGERPGESLDLGNWFEEPITVQEREFRARQASFGEQVQAASIPAEGTTRQILDAGLTYLAALLTARAVDGEPVTSEWLMENLGASDVTELTGLLQSGPQEDEDPNAEAQAPGSSEADESPTSAA